MKGIWSFITVVVMAIFILPITAYATEESTEEVTPIVCGDYEYTLNENNEATITAYNGTATELVIPEKLDGYTVVEIGDSAFSRGNLEEEILSVVIPDTVIKIGSSAFSYNNMSKGVKLSKKVKEIGAYAFSNCDGLTYIEIPKTVEATNGTGKVFNDCDNLKKITIEEGATKVVANFFEDCYALEEVIIPSTVKTIEDKAFYHCNLKTVDLKYGLESIGEYAFCCACITSIDIPDSVTTLGWGAFENCTSLKNVTLSDQLEEMGRGAFTYCAIEEIVIPKSLKSVNYQSNWSSIGPFRYCYNLKKIILEDGTTEIIPGLFAECPGLEEYTVPNTVTQIGEAAFRGCTSLDMVCIPDSVTEIGESAFSGCTALNRISLSNNLSEINTSTFADCKSLTTIELPESIVQIDERAFTGSGIKEIILPNQLTEIKNLTFYECDSLIKVVIPNNVNKIGGWAFYGCQNLSDVTLSNSLTDIGFYAFGDCLSLKQIVLPHRVTQLIDGVFSDGTKLNEITMPSKVNRIHSNAFTDPTTLTVNGYEGSYAEQWANEVGATFVAMEVTDTPVYVEIQGAVDEETSLEFFDAEGNKITTANVTGSSSSEPLVNLPMGTYTMKVSKENYVPRTYTIEVEMEVAELEVELHKTGDITGDDTINARDKKMLYNHIAGTAILEDYDFAVGDVTGDGTLNARDKKMIYNHIAGTSSLWE